MRLRNWATTVLLSSFFVTSWVIASSAFNAMTSAESIAAKPIVVSKAEFGLFKFDHKGKVTFIPTDKVLLTEGNQYGWRIWLKDYHGEVKWREVLRLPKLPESWSTDHGENFSMTANGTGGVTTRTQPVKNGVIQNYWTVLHGDPVGKHTVEVYVYNRRLASFNFEVLPLNNLPLPGLKPQKF
ncbi:hypothetical protein G7B40_024260 [Aetokthonos hydrillicola Thurmond2011]|jgi:hypothetical protein|uniref:Proteinase inhibitor I42 chagasin domain-containing protein n=1 Tax=Aetokthonos hydrillicola Thurmond2011 TaxID=2712845 RepID=A0AAP5IDE4_9CYAN|nr:hypothetical protein [Aetokthonos hydrillicola]MBO3461099.1 hypothetical protein [Aetokthonos hydrillicola CCALA 1050]MBW4590680.1 hypothetical protein [Aetokthonos hydrillicola CCALA 1050]MDR9897658.1 hypothetical protein [Aetokthonos hydrillicola Thurmond2011]